MIITRLAGGLGNQMFQYAIARSYQRTNDEKVILDDRLLQELETDIDKIIQRPLALNIFPKLKATIIDQNTIDLISSRVLITRIKRKLFKLSPTRVIQQLMEPIAFVNINSKNIYLEGNFQSELYFKSIRKDLLDEYSFPELDSNNKVIQETILSTPDSLSLHIRRGDYHSTSNKSIFTSVNLQYYQNAISILLRKVGIKRLTAFVFTDDINWVKENFKSHQLDLHFVEGNYANNSWKDMYLMSCCKHHIIANSSFSWWGAWLSKLEGINLAPKHWFRPNTYKYDIDNIVPESWTIVDYNL